MFGATLLLLFLGIVMVLSASTVESYREFGSAYTLWLRQVMYAIVGIVVMVVVSRFPVITWRKLAKPFMVGSVGLLMLVLVIGHSVAGQRNWIEIWGPFRFQPSEFAKLAIVLWGADVMARKYRHLHEWRELLIPFVPVAALIVGLVVLEGDVGTALIMVPMVATVLFINGAPMKLFAAGGVAVVVAVGLLTLQHSYRLNRFGSWLHPTSDAMGAGWQVLQGKSALGGGGWFGVGLGASREKWDWLPEAHTDFIFAVVGEELGILGSLLVIGLFAIVCVSGLRLARRASDPFIRTASATAVAWISTQMLINLGAVLQLLPITGVPLPLVSYGGSSLIPTLAVLGMLMSFARAEAKKAPSRSGSRSSVAAGR